MRTKEEILELLSDVEIARVSNVEANGPLEEGAEFVDLDHIDRGIQQAHGELRQVHTVVTRASVSDETWRRIQRELEAT
jgi:hypothetical protein